jgi:flavin reductase (DIM6/NTAB) family NADH-FMN oxidoreductase RutF
MTIGWGSLGIIWGIPIWTVLVRPSRYTYQCLEHSQCFTVNVPGADLAKACALCGSKSGRDMDKLTACGLTARKADKVAAPILEQCPIVYQCKVVHRNYVVPSALARQVQEGAYVNGDYHGIYYGQILAAHAAPDAATLLR